MTSEPLPEWNDIRFLDSQAPELRVTPDGLRLSLETGESWAGVTLCRAFPLSDPARFLGILDAEGRDIGVIADPSLLSEESRRIVAEELEARYFLPRVEKVYSVKEEYGSLYWDVETDHGRKEIVVANPRDSLVELGPTRIMMTDVDGLRYEFPDIHRLDTRTQTLLLRNL